MSMNYIDPFLRYSGRLLTTARLPAIGSSLTAPGVFGFIGVLLPAPAVQPQVPEGQGADGCVRGELGVAERDVDRLSWTWRCGVCEARQD